MNSFERNIELFGTEKNEKITNQHVIIFGLGGVGGYAVEAIARLGVKEISIVDFDIVEETNINRQIIATTDNLGKFKTDLFEQRILQINPECIIHKYTEKMSAENINKMMVGITFCVDAIDSLENKVDIYKFCIKNNIKFISSMGMALKENPQEVKIMKLSKTKNNKLAKKMRILCKNNRLNLDKINVVTSEEQIECNIAKGSLPSIMLAPAAAGLCCTYFYIKSI